jgi:N6-L-threonylcarbamoyladenine synthase
LVLKNFSTILLLNLTENYSFTMPELNQNSLILAIETSCDETAAAIIQGKQILSNVVKTQVEHSQFGGVVPELASRKHLTLIAPVVKKALEEAQIEAQQLNAVAFTQGPGLLGALLVGGQFAKGLSISLNIPLIPVHHIYAHIMAHFIGEPKPGFPFICLTVSGGHTQLVLVKSWIDLEILGETKDDAVGEAFDKGAKMLGLPYPGGPEIDKLASVGDPAVYDFPVSNMEGNDFSFSGLKTSLLYFINKKTQKEPNFIEEHVADIAASFQRSLLDSLFAKLEKVMTEQKINQVAIAGGVAANKGLRQRLKVVSSRNGWEYFIPEFSYCTDNAAMIAIAAKIMLDEGIRGTLKDEISARLPLVG